MEKKRKIQLAAEMLKNSYGYASEENPSYGFDFIVDEENERIEIFSVSEFDDAFYWTERLVGIAKSLELSIYPSIFRFTHKGDERIEFPRPKIIYFMG